MKIYLIMPPSKYGTVRAFTTMKAAREALRKMAKELGENSCWKPKVFRWKGGNLCFMNKDGGLYMIEEAEVEE